MKANPPATARKEREATLGLSRSLVIGAFILALPLAFITTNVRVALSEQAVYDYSVRTYNAEQATGIPEPELIRANAELRRYLTQADPGLLAVKVRNAQGELVSLFNARETAHMADVRDLVRVLFLVQSLALAAVLTLAVAMLALWPPRALAAASLYGAVLTAGIVGLAGLLAVSGFDTAWDRFHTIVFRNDLWQLDPHTDHLIQMFPEPFWQKITLLLGGATLAEASVLALLSAAYLYLSRPRAGEPSVLLPAALSHAPSVRNRPQAPGRQRFVH